jgi:xanthine dehydrogenase YagS FAD-binding subunit
VQPLSYSRVNAVADAVRLGAAGATYYAGGTTLIDLMKLDVLAPAKLVDINRLPLAAITSARGSLHLGATTRMSDAADDALVRERVPAIAQALAASASGQLRNMATLGGNLLQRTRCAYFRDVATPCNKRDPDSGCGARLGISEEHAVLGTSDRCIAVHASDFAVPLIAFDATIDVTGPKGTRTIAAAEFFISPGETPQRETLLEAGDLIVGIDVPYTPAAARSTYLKVRDRTSYAFALASCAAGVERASDGTLTDVRVALGGVATIPWRARATEQHLRGKAPDDALLFTAAAAAFDDARPTLQNAYKIDLAIAAIVRALRTVLE